MSACPACSTENPAVAKFCAHCGASLAAACPSCGTAAPTGARFCMECGNALATTTEAPPSPAAVPVAGEKKHITVLFADVAGSMDLQERLDAEVWAQIMGRFVSILAEGVRRFGGTVDKFTGDGIMALFGAPVAQEDHARRACHAAWHLTKAIGEWSEELRNEQGVELQVRLGLNSGEVVVGRVGDDVTLDPTALGHTVGLAQRMEAMAEPGKAFLTEYTARLVEGWFDLQHLGARPVKGARDLLGVHVLDGPSSLPPVLHGAGLGIAPLVGRDRELQVLEDALAMAVDGHAQVVGVVGEAGVGKSRLCEEFAASAMARGITVRRTAGISHAKDLPLLPVLSLYRDYFGIIDTDRPEEARGKISKRVLGLDPELEASLPLLFDFLEVPDPDRPAPQLAPDVRMRQLFATIRRLTARRSEREVLLLVAEDLHWFDEASEVFLERLIDSFPGSRTLVVANFRPEFSARWTRHSYYRQVALAPLHKTAVGELLERLLGSDRSLEPLVGFVQERTAGNPFFVEEVVRAFVEDGTLADGPGGYRLARRLHEVKVPLSVQAVLAARIDRLDPQDKAVLQSASVIGRTFSEALLVKVAGLGERAFHESLRNLCAAELVQEFEDHGAAGYRFWHPLTQEVAYSGLLRHTQESLHEAVAVGIIDNEPDRVDENAALIATHFERAGNHLEAATWNERAANWALRRDVSEAMRRWRATITHLEAVPGGDDSWWLGIRTRNRLLRYGGRTGMDSDEAQRLYRDGRALAERLQNVGALASVTTAYASLKVWHGDIPEGGDLYREAARLADQTADRRFQPLWASVAWTTALTGPIAEGLEIWKRLDTIIGDDLDAGMEVYGFSARVFGFHGRAHLLALSGRLEQAREEADSGLRLARQRDEPEILAWTLSIYSRLAIEPADLEEALKRAEEAVRVADDSANPSGHVTALTAVGIARIGLGAHDEAVSALTAGLAEARSRQVARFEEGTILTHLARALAQGGDAVEAQRMAAEAVEVAHRQGALVVECLALLTRAQLLRAINGSAARPLDDLNRALTLARQTGARLYEPFIHEELGRLHDDATELSEAMRLYRQIGATGHARRLEEELSARRLS